MAATEARVRAEAATRPMTAADAEAGFALSQEAGWNQTLEDWRFMLAEGRGLGVHEPGRGFVASSLVLPLGAGLSWISMVLVARDRRRNGLGTMLLSRCVEAARAAGAVPGLDATEIGRPVYLPLGFRDLYPISRLVLEAPLPEVRPPDGVRLRALAPADLPALTGYDERHSRMQRGHVLSYLAGRAPACIAERGGAVVAYAMGRPGRTAAQIGPVVADNPDVALALVARIGARGGRTMLDVPDAHVALADFLQRHGAVRERGYMRMTLGRFPGIESPGGVFALAGPELA